MNSSVREALNQIGSIAAFVAENCGNIETSKYMNDIISIVQKTTHPNWFSATDYKWLREHRPPKTDMSYWDKLDDENRRNVANWSDNDFTQ